MPNITHPSDWRALTVRDIGDVQLGRQRSPATERGANMVPYLRVANVFDGHIDYSDILQMNFSPEEQLKYAIRRGDILLNEGQSLELVGRSAVYDGADDLYCFQNTLVRFRTGPSADASYVRAVFKRWLDIGHFARIAKRTTSVAHLGAARFAKLEIPMPPLPEQGCIAAVLDTLDEVIRKTEQLVAKLKQMKQTLLHDLLTRGIDEKGELRDPEQHSERFKDSALGRIPAAWSSVPFREVCISSAFGPRFSSERYTEQGGLATLRTTDMDDEGNIDLSTMPRAAVNPSSMASHLLQIDDLLISRSGTCGIVAVFPGYEIPVVPGAFLIRFRLRGRILSEFLRRYFNSTIGRPRLDRLAAGGVQKNLKGSELLAMMIPLPTPGECKRILSVIEANEVTIRREQEQLAKLRLLKQGLMDDLLTGRVRVTPLLAEPTS
ncbi:restriction endonuclease subunit S [Sorangium sp. So ce1151]|uniref:restriction endonuclease subunit S n=1 Tax=Sorangium sp. So ce1151 TaxID=3133332 RepID=UPI003F614D3D